MEKTASYQTISNIEEFKKASEDHDVVVYYFSHEQCNVCKVLKPKIAEMLSERFPKARMFYADTVKTPEIAAQNSVFAVPTILVFVAGRETIRKSRNIGVEELAQLIQRPYDMVTA